MLHDKLLLPDPLIFCKLSFQLFNVKLLGFTFFINRIHIHVVCFDLLSRSIFDLSVESLQVSELCLQHLLCGRVLAGAQRLCDFLHVVVQLDSQIAEVRFL